MEIYFVGNVTANDENGHYPFLFLSVPKKAKVVKKAILTLKDAGGVQK